MLETLTLPDTSYVTEDGVRSLLERLQHLQSLNFPGNLGRVFQLDWEPLFGPTLELTNFSQLLTTSSGRVENYEDQEETEINCWEPNTATMERISRLCPNLTKIKVLMADLDLRYFETFPNLEEVEAHITWGGITAGISR